MGPNPNYSENALIADLRSWWNDQLSDDPFADPRSPAGTIFEVVPLMDSLCVVSALVTVEKHLDSKVSPQIIKPGGYASCEEMIADLVPKIRALWAKQRKREAA